LLTPYVGITTVWETITRFVIVTITNPNENKIWQMVKGNMEFMIVTITNPVVYMTDACMEWSKQV